MMYYTADYKTDNSPSQSEENLVLINKLREHRRAYFVKVK
jgi:hypothetical protein